MPQEYSARIRGRRLQRIRAFVLSHNPLCVQCSAVGITSAATQVDHIVALVNGGEDTTANLQALCDECHRLKTADDLGNKRRTGADIKGIPTDKSHHWHTG